MLLLGCWAFAAGGQPRPETQSGAEVSNEQLAHAKTVFQERCVRCHGANGQGQTVLGSMLRMPDFTARAWWREDVSNRRLINSVTNGKNEMPAFGKKLTRTEINSLVAYVRRFYKAAAEKQNSSR